MSARRLALLLSALALAAAGCAVTEAGVPTAALDSGGSGAGPSDDRHGAPRVREPLDASRFLTDPCGLLTPEQMRGFDISRPGVIDSTGALAEHVGMGCFWSSDDDISRGYGIGWLVGNRNGLADTYRGRDRFAGYFEPTEVDGYPAVLNDVTDERDKGECNIVVAVSDTLTFLAGESSGFARPGSPPCERSRELAAAALATLKGRP